MFRTTSEHVLYGCGYSCFCVVMGCSRHADLVFGPLQVLQHLDNQGCAAVASVLRSMPQDSILLIGQDNTFATESFDTIDVVTKQGGCSTVKSRGIDELFEPVLE